MKHFVCFLILCLLYAGPLQAQKEEKEVRYTSEATWAPAPVGLQNQKTSTVTYAKVGLFAPVMVILDDDHKNLGLQPGTRLRSIPAILAAFFIEKKNSETNKEMASGCLDITLLAAGVGEVALAIKAYQAARSVRTLFRLTLAAADIAASHIDVACKSADTELCNQWKEISFYIQIGLLTTNAADGLEALIKRTDAVRGVGGELGKNATDIIKKLPKSIVDDLSGFSEEAFGRIIKDLGDDPKLIEELLKNPKLVDSWKLLKDMPDGVRTGINSLTTVSKWLDEGIELTFEAIQEGSKILNKNGDEVGKLLKEGSDEILEIFDDFIVSAASSASKKLDGILIRSNTGETFINASFVKNVDGSIGFVEDVSSYGSQAVQNTIKQRGALRRPLTGIKTTEDAHHIIPVQLLKENDVVKKAVEAGFEFNTSKNALAIEKFVKSTGAGRHGPHPSYTTQLREHLNWWARQPGNANFTPDGAKTYLDALTSNLKTKINASSSKINDLALGLPK